MFPRRAQVVALALTALLAGCAARPAQTPTPLAAVPTAQPTAAPTAAPTDAPPPTLPPAPTAEPTSAATPAPTPMPGVILPRPLYVLLAGQIFRLEIDGATRTQITYEVPFQPELPPIVDFDVAPVSGDLVYVVQRAGTSVLVRSGPGGEDTAPLYDDPLVSPSEPLFTPDGAAVALRLTASAGASEGFVSGLYLLPLGGGEPRLLVPDDVGLSPEGLAFGHVPAAFSRDGARLLTYRTALNVDTCDLAVVSLADGASVPVQVPPVPAGERVTTCGPAAWGSDNASLFYVPTRIGAGSINTAIWRADPATGESFPITPQPEAPPLTLYAFPGVAADGTLLAFTTQADALPVPFFDQPPALEYTMAEIDIPTGAARAVRPAMPELPATVLWEPKGAGAVAVLFPREGAAGLWWLPASGGQPAPLLDDVENLSLYKWLTQ